MSRDLEDELVKAALILRNAKCIAVLTGAGISAESGVPTFRASDGLWEGHPIEDVATPDGFARDPKLVWAFYNARRDNLTRVQPNAGHHALVEMEKRWAPNFALVTQNVDNLHRTAGSERVHELHGNIHHTRCTKCFEIENRGLEPLGELPACPKCGHMLRPHIVWFHEALDDDVMTAAYESILDCDCLIVVGTSAVVYPAAGLIPLAKRKTPPALVIEVNIAETAASDIIDVGLYGPSGEILPKLLAMVENR